MSVIKHISIIGTGNVATEMAKLFLRNNFIIDGVYGRSSIDTKSLDPHLYQSNYNEISQNSDLYLISVSDDSYLDILRKLELKNPFIVHTSGNLESSVLELKTNRWGCFYPLQTIKKNQNISWDKVPFLIEASNKKDLSLLSNLCSLNNLRYSVKDSEARNKMHVAAVAANNFTYYLLSEVKEYCKKYQLDFTDLKPLIEKSIQNILDTPGHTLQTGPAVRADLKVIERQLNSLKEDKDLQDIYQLFTKKIIKKHQNELQDKTF